MRTNPRRTAKEAVNKLIQEFGASGTILGLSEALADLGVEWRGDAGAASGIEAVTGYAPHADDDWRWAARCGECAGCQEYMVAPNPLQFCMRRTSRSDRPPRLPAHPTGGFAHYGCKCAGCKTERAEHAARRA